MKTYKIDTTNYTEDQITLLATNYGYPLEIFDEETHKFVLNQADKMAFIESEFKKMADEWFARPLIYQVEKQIEQKKQEEVQKILDLISSSTVIETE